MSDKKDAPQASDFFEETPIVKPEFNLPSEEEFHPLEDAIGADYSKKRLPLFLLIPIIIAVLLFFFLLYNNFFNFYRRTLFGLDFDYRNGESVTDVQILEQPISKTVADSIPTDSSLQLKTAEYSVSEVGKVGSEVTKYEYFNSTGEETLKIKTGKDKFFLSSSDSLRRNGEGQIEEKHFGKWDKSEESIQNLRAFFFSVESDDDYEIKYHSTQKATIEDENYDCEIWLMTRTVYSSQSYYTIYRYYQNNTLKGVRILSNYSDMMQIFDVKSYEFT